MENIQKSFDVIVVGAGTGGTTAARFAANNGLNVCLIDGKKREKIGDKICGDAIGTDVFQFLGINHPKGPELSCYIKGAKLYSPDLKKCITMVDPKQAGYVVNRLEFGQRLLQEALDAGINQFLDKTMAIDLLYKKNYVCGVKVKLSGGEMIDLNAKIVIDASGFHSPLRKIIKSDIIEKEIPKNDYMLCYREIVEFDPKDLPVNDPEHITIILDQDKAPGGYIWYFPKNERSLNIGLGVYVKYKGKVKDFYQKNAFKYFIKTPNYKITSTGGGVVPVRRPLWSCADNGIMFVGDSGCQVNPLHGGGIDPSMRAGYHAANTAKEAIDKGDFSLKTLWDYNYKIMTTFGSEYAALDLLRIVLQRLSNDDLNFGLGHDLLSGSEILQIAETGSLKLSLFDLAAKAIRGIKKPGLLLDLNFLRVHMGNIAKHYQNYPKNKEGLEEWKEKTQELYKKMELVNPQNSST